MKNIFKRFVTVIINILLIFLFLYSLLDFCAFPEVYVTTWKNELKQDIDSENIEALQYYKTNYIDKGVILFEK